jgi:hypothetical protein
VVELVRESLQLLERPVVVGLRPGATEPSLDRRAVPLSGFPHQDKPGLDREH